MSNPEEDAWRQIVEHYGDAPEFPDEPAADLDVPPEEPSPEPEEEEGFVPPEPPPVPRPHGSRLVAWLGVFAAPLLLVASAIVGYGLPPFLSTLLVVWFLGGFGYLVWQMPRQRDDPWDDGARL